MSSAADFYSVAEAAAKAARVILKNFMILVIIYKIL